MHNTLKHTLLIILVLFGYVLVSTDEYNTEQYVNTMQNTCYSTLSE
jgi:hypothetical protein